MIELNILSQLKRYDTLWWIINEDKMDVGSNTEGL